MIVEITDHINAALKRLATQYRDAEKLKSLVSVLSGRFQDVETAIKELNEERSLDTSIGVQLDGIGQIVGIGRDNLGDSDYRVRIKARILVNISEGEPEIIINIFQLLTGSNAVLLTEHYPGGVGLSGDGLIPSGKERFFASLIEQALAAGVRLDSMSYFDSSNPFSFFGDVFPSGGGFGSIYDSNVGGILGGIYLFDLNFAFNSSDLDSDGFGSVYDSNIGGRFLT